MLKPNKIKIVLVGCGRIGTGTGTKNNRVQSHAAALGRLPVFDVTLFDKNTQQARSAAKVFGFSFIERIDKATFETSQCVVICSPTSTHSDYLSQFLNSGIPLIICEKPICSSIKQAKKLQQLRERSKSRVLVNYTRRFLPSYKNLKNQFSLLSESESLQTISVRYQRGFLNNALHALDLIQFLTNWDICDAKVRPVQAIKNEISDDPTISCYGKWNDTLLSILGLPGVRYSLLEIDLFFDRSAIRLRDRGDTVEVSSSDEPSDYYAPLETRTLTRKNLNESLVKFYRHVQQMTINTHLPDNFDESLKLASWALKTLKQSEKARS